MQISVFALVILLSVLIVIYQSAELQNFHKKTFDALTITKGDLRIPISGHLGNKV